MISRRIAAVVAAVALVALIGWTRRSTSDDTPASTVAPANAAEPLTGAPATNAAAGTSAEAREVDQGKPTTTQPSNAAGENASAVEVAIGFVAETGDLLRMGPLKFRDAIRAVAIDEMVDRMISEMETSRGAIAKRASAATQALWWLEAPITVSPPTTTGNGDVEVRVWSVVINANPHADHAAPPVAGWRTSTVTLRHTDTAWRIAGFDAAEGPTPSSTDQLPSGWADFADVAGWSSAIHQVSSLGVDQ